MKLWRKYIGVFAVLSFLMAGLPSVSYASIVCEHDESTAKTVMVQNSQTKPDSHVIGKSHDMETVHQKAMDKKDCCGAFCDGLHCGKMPLVTPAEVTDFKIPSLSGYEVFDLTANGTHLERLMRPPIFR